MRKYLFTFVNLQLALCLKSGLVPAGQDISNPASAAKSSLPEKLANLFSTLKLPTKIQDLGKLAISVPPVKLDIPTNMTHGTIQQVRENIGRSFISICSKDGTLTPKCICDKYTNLKILYNRDWKSIAMVAIDKQAKLIVVSYRGTKEGQNYFTDLNYLMVDFPGLPKGSKVHSGFLNQYLSLSGKVEDAVIEVLDNVEFKNFTLHITGYSLGATTSLLSAPSWIKLLKSRNDTRNIEVYAYASPRIGNSKLASYLATLNVPITRYTNQNDIVPHFPPRSYDFVHAGVEVHEYESNKLKVCSQIYDEDPTCAYSRGRKTTYINHLYTLGEYYKTPYC